MKNSDYRVVAKSVLVDRGFDVQPKAGQGYLPGARLTASKAGQKIDVAVKASQQRSVSFSKQADGRWRTLNVVDQVVVIVPAEDNEAEADIFAFERKALTPIFDRAWKALERAKRPIGVNMPVFVPIGANSQKNVGHDVAGLKELAKWTVRLSEHELIKRSEITEESYVLQFRRRFAAENGVDIDQVVISIIARVE